MVPQTLQHPGRGLTTMALAMALTRLMTSWPGHDWVTCSHR